jgi:catechol 2,3-dioxygenase-like lactoylglutathione lyase family enzyme
MLAEKDAMATVAVKDLAAARKFYEGVLGLRVMGPGDSEAITYKTGTSRLVVYRSQFAGTNQATAVTWPVGGELEAIVGALRDRGVTFEHYDTMLGITRQGDIHVAADDFKVAWFKDPDGNIISLFNR